MRYLSVCSGIEAATVAWKPLGWEAVAFAEIEAFPRAVLKHHYPDVPLHGDFAKLRGDEHGSVDLVVGGTPCQSFSVAGLRAGMDDPRGNLALAFLGLAARARPTWVVWENVPGVLSSVSHAAPDPSPPPAPLDLGCDGAEVETEDDYRSEELHALNCFLAGLSELGYGWAYRILDAEYFGVPQRRRRPFVVGYLGDWRRAVAVLFERESLSGNPPPSREAGAQVASTLTQGAESSGRGGYAGRRREDDVNLVVAALTTTPYADNEAQESRLVVGTLGHNGKAAGSATQQDAETGMLVAFNLRGREGGAMPEAADVASLRASSGGSSRSYVAYGGNNTAGPIDVATAVNAHGGTGRHDFESETFVVQTGVRRLTVTECERLQGFPDGYTQVPHRGKPAADSPRYRALGNSMAVPVMRWIGERIQQVEAL